MGGRWAVCGAAACVLLVAGCSGGGARGAARPEGDCAWRLTYGKRVYVPPGPGAGSGAVRHEGKPIGRGTFAGCADGGGGAWGIAVYRIAGVDPARAVVTRDDEVGVVDPGHLPAG